jgi:hypothetical protein
MTPMTLTLIGGAVFLACVLLGFCFAVTQGPNEAREPVAVRICFLFAAFGAVLMFGATVAEIAVRIFLP